MVDVSIVQCSATVSSMSCFSVFASSLVTHVLVVVDNPKGWVGYGEARGSIAAFLFVYKRGLGALPTKLRKVGGPSLAQQDLPEIGPSFGADCRWTPQWR